MHEVHSQSSHATHGGNLDKKRGKEKKTELAIKKNSVDSLQPVSNWLTNGPEGHVRGKQRSRGGEVTGVQLRPANREERCFLYVLVWPCVLFISQYPKQVMKTLCKLQ